MFCVGRADLQVPHLACWLLVGNEGMERNMKIAIGCYRVYPRDLFPENTNQQVRGGCSDKHVQTQEGSTRGGATFSQGFSLFSGRALATCCNICQACIIAGKPIALDFICSKFQFDYS